MNSRGGDQEEFKVDTVSESESNVDVESRNFFMVLNIEIVWLEMLDVSFPSDLGKEPGFGAN